MLMILRAVLLPMAKLAHLVAPIARVGRARERVPYASILSASGGPLRYSSDLLVARAYC